MQHQLFDETYYHVKLSFQISRGNTEAIKGVLCITVLSTMLFGGHQNDNRTLTLKIENWK